ncbi:MAG: hypothetical protein CMP54_01310 [Flavobacteriales bacterium]|nr:hypothetical protein [Flavobacteriales bacterium]
MNLTKILLSGSQYFILNKDLIKMIGLEPTLILAQLVEFEENKSKDKNAYFRTTIEDLISLTSLSNFKIKNGINNLYKNKLIDIIVNKNKTIDVKIFHLQIFNLLNIDFKLLKKNKVKKKSIINQKRFKKPKLKELKNYFLKINELDESEIMFDYYESKGWKVGSSPMKCWKSAARNWARRGKKKIKFPDYYDKNIELKIGNDSETLSKYHNHLKKLGWISKYSPSAGITWGKIK